MGSTRNIKKRIDNISSVEQIIKAMDMVASTKLVKARRQLDGVRPISKELKGLVEEVAQQEKARDHMCYQKQEVKQSLYIILTSNRGLAGGYNNNICKMALDHMEDKNEKIIIAGSKGYEFFVRYNKNLIHSIVDVADDNVYYGAESLSKKTVDLYLTGEVQEVFICYTQFENVLTHKPVIEKLLPIPIREDGYMEDDDRKYEPSLSDFIGEMLPLYLHMSLFRAFSEAHTSEQAARMVNMDSAGKNAEEMLEELNRTYNRIRQAAITQELTEIVGSASVLSKGGED